MKTFNSLYLSTLLIVALVCLEKHKADLESELSDYNYVLKKISEDSKSAFEGISSIINRESEMDGVSNSVFDTLRTEINQVKSIINHNILLKSESNMSLLSKHGVELSSLSGQEELNPKDIYLITKNITINSFDEYTRLEKLRSVLNEETRILISSKPFNSCKKNKQYKFWFSAIYLTQPEKSHKYKISYDGVKEDHIYNFPYLIPGSPDTVNIQLDMTNQMTGENYHLKNTVSTKDYQL